ncbi:MAG: methyl-accepting chemotaxis protein, partial [Nitrospira sp.]|nr:methyl-accepting chemotaxis protein [Nitrospira sp.]
SCSKRAIEATPTNEEEQFMKWFLNLSTRAKLFLGFGLMIVFLIIIIVTAYISIVAIQESQKILFEKDFIIATDLLELKSNQNRQHSQILEMTLRTSKSDQESIEQNIKASAKEIDEWVQKLFEHGRDDPKLLERLEELKTILDAYRQTRETQIALIYEGGFDEARQLAIGVQDERYERMRSIIKELVDEIVERARIAVVQSGQRANQSVRVFIIIGVIALLAGVVLIVFLNRILANPLKEISGVAEQIASGDLTVDLPANNRTDEVGTLTQTFTRMIQSLQEMARVAEQIAKGNLTVGVRPQAEKDILGNTFAAMVENLRKVTQEIREGVSVLASSISEILAATTQVASGAAETATAVSQTTTAVEEVKQTAQVSSQKAKYVSESAQKAAQVSQNGKKSVEVSIEGMNSIREQMESIAESIVRLSEQSQAIGEIIATVNDLAEQSNLLAFNAAIEAVKAGEQGKGFAVVAQEIRNLADQSKQATAQVRAILNDIQKATSAAVMATEQGSKVVEAGVKQSMEVGESIRVLADSVTESAQAATQITASSQQQLVGMDQVAMAMENIKQTSAQNVTSTRQVEVAAQSLHELGQRLRQLVERYRV